MRVSQISHLLVTDAPKLSSFTCTNGLQCKSKFIESASSGSSDFSTKFATNVNGSTKWKNLE